jgi:hypothetical protein
LAFALGALVAVAQPAAAQQSPLAGGWGGALEVQAIRLRLTLAVADSGGALTGRFVSVDQGNSTFPATVAVRGDSAFFEMPMIGARYRAVLVGRDTLRGEWMQGAGVLPLTMVRGANAGMVLRRPQLPSAPCRDTRPIPRRLISVRRSTARLTVRGSRACRDRLRFRSICTSLFASSFATIADATPRRCVRQRRSTLMRPY